MDVMNFELPIGGHNYIIKANLQRKSFTVLDGLQEIAEIKYQYDQVAIYSTDLGYAIATFPKEEYPIDFRSAASCVVDLVKKHIQYINENRGRFVSTTKSQIGHIRCKPPLGVMPERVWKDQRIIELCAAINRQIESCIPNYELIHQWADEICRGTTQTEDSK